LLNLKALLSNFLRGRRGRDRMVV